MKSFLLGFLLLLVAFLTSWLVASQELFLMITAIIGVGGLLVSGLLLGTFQWRNDPVHFKEDQSTRNTKSSWATSLFLFTFPHLIAVFVGLYLYV
ncbi:DUF5316 family protein [Geomicrobium sp. JCM 19038]|uniref:DUF5316 family protein n=1 Tax=Geomicrobium sp. JCM 19038 TaxID=1460635 RepID=UPI00045F1C5A|nr:DUF5316 family protein [Geomicrobium sp. JCM 19038]GAK08023.1 hypothetical protein JCM19038_1786 [Geomicrobium sp. JCM 19038]